MKENSLSAILYCSKEGKIRREIQKGVLRKRQYQVGILIVEGKSQNEIADVLNISKSAVRKHIDRLKECLGCKNLQGISAVFIWLLQAQGHLQITVEKGKCIVSLDREVRTLRFA